MSANSLFRRVCMKIFLMSESDSLGEDVINNVHQEFVNQGVEDHILTRLQTEWEQRFNTAEVVQIEEFKTESIKTEVEAHTNICVQEEKEEKPKIIKTEQDDLDDPELEIYEDEEPTTENYVLCQFEKITRVKNKRKCILGSGIMHLNGQEYVFHKATGEFEW